MADQVSVFRTSSAAETIELGRTLASRLKPGDIVAFYGELGAGKTTMIKGVAAGLGVTEVVKSPSFVIATVYQGRFPIYHIDLYRLGHGVQSPESRVQSHMVSDEIESLGLESYFAGDGVCLVEWAERAERVLPESAIRVRMSVEGSGRRIEITGLRVALQPGQ